MLMLVGLFRLVLVGYFCEIGGNCIGSAGAKLLLKSNFTLLEKLRLSTNPITPEKCKLGDEGTKHLSKLILPNLKWLDLSNINL